MVESDNASSAADDARRSKFGKTKGPRTQKPNNDANQQAAGDFLKLVFFDKKLLGINFSLLPQQSLKLSAIS